MFTMIRICFSLILLRKTAPVHTVLFSTKYTMRPHPFAYSKSSVSYQSCMGAKQNQNDFTVFQWMKNSENAV